MPSKLDLEDHRYDMKESSGQLIDQVGTADSTTAVNLDYSKPNSNIWNGVDSKVIIPSAGWDTSNDFTGYIAYRNLGLPGLTEQFWTMDPNAGDKPVASWNGVTQDFFWSASVTGSGNVVLANGADLDPTDLIVQAFSYDLSTRLISMSVESSSGISKSGAATETSTPTGNGDLKIGVNGPNSAFTNFEVLQIGTYITVFGATDLTDTALDLLARLSVVPDNIGGRASRRAQNTRESRRSRVNRKSRI